MFTNTKIELAIKAPSGHRTKAHVRNLESGGSFQRLGGGGVAAKGLLSTTAQRKGP